MIAFELNRAFEDQPTYLPSCKVFNTLLYRFQFEYNWK